jgi:hypothetical protein
MVEKRFSAEAPQPGDKPLIMFIKIHGLRSVAATLRRKPERRRDPNCPLCQRTRSIGLMSGTMMPEQLPAGK